MKIKSKLKKWFIKISILILPFFVLFIAFFGYKLFRLHTLFVICPYCQVKYMAKNDLKMLYKAQLNYYEKNQNYAKDSEKLIDYMQNPELIIHFTFSVCTDSSCIKGQFHDNKVDEFLKNKPIDDSYFLYALANLDNDEDIEIWAITKEGEVINLNRDISFFRRSLIDAEGQEVSLHPYEAL